MDFSLSTYYPIFIYLVVVVGFSAAAMLVPPLIVAETQDAGQARCPTNPAWTRSATPGSASTSSST